MKQQFASKAEAEAEKQRLREVLPPVKSAYTPSGKLPAAALPGMSLGTLVGVPAGVAAGLAAAVTFFCRRAPASSEPSQA